MRPARARARAARVRHLRAQPQRATRRTRAGSSCRRRSAGCGRRRCGRPRTTAWCTGGGRGGGSRRRTGSWPRRVLATAVRPRSPSRGGPSRPGASAGAEADRFGSALYGLAELARDEGGLVGALRSEGAVRTLERACRAPGALRARARRPRARSARRRRPHRAGAAPALPRLVRGRRARLGRPLPRDGRRHGRPARPPRPALLRGAAARHGVRRAAAGALPRVRAPSGTPPRYGRCSPRSTAGSPAEVYRRAALITPGNTHARRWQERCGADRAKLRTVYPGMEASRFAEVGESAEAPGARTRTPWSGSAASNPPRT